MPLIRSRLVQLEGFVRFFCGNISTSNGSRTSHSASVKLLEYGIVTSLESNMTLLHPSKRCQMGSIQTFGKSDTVMVLFEEQNGDLKYIDGDDDSGTDLNSQIKVRLYQGKRYILRIRLYFNSVAGETSVMVW